MTQELSTVAEADSRPDDCIACRYRLCALVPPERRAACQSFRTLGRGESLHVDNRACLRFWIVIQGTAANCASLRDGRRQIVDLAMAGDLICGLSAAEGADSRIEVLADSKICDIDLSSRAETLLDDPDLAAEMFRNVHSRLARSALQTVALGRLDSTERICFFLLEMARRASGNRSRSTPVRVELPMSREDIADFIGLNTETVSRLLTRIKKQGLVVFLSPTTYIIPDLAAMERRVPFRHSVDPPTLNQGQCTDDY